MYGIIYNLQLLFIAIVIISCAPSRKTSLNSLQPDTVLRATWGAASPLPYQQHHPVRITIHHEGTKLELTDDAAAKIKAIQKWGMGPDRKWADIPYHFLIAPDGIIYEGRDPFTVGETATEYDPKDIY